MLQLSFWGFFGSSAGGFRTTSYITRSDCRLNYVHSLTGSTISFDARDLGLVFLVNKVTDSVSQIMVSLQVFESRCANSLFGGFVWGNFLQGFSVGWWKTKHNIHHAAPNQCDDHYQPVDPDIDTLPLLAWSKDILDTVDSKLFRSIIKRQHFIFVPLLFFARFSWLQSSWTHTNIANMSTGTRIMEKAFLALHYLLFGGLGLWCLPPGLALIWFVTAQVLSGAMLSGVFVISHNGMEVYNDNKDFVSAQVHVTGYWSVLVAQPFSADIEQVFGLN